LTVIPLADSFAPASRADWLALVEKTLKGAGVETLITRAGALEIEPLYEPADATQRARFASSPRGGDPAWDIRAAIRQPGPAAAQEALLEELAGGAASVLISIDPTGAAGVAVGSAERLAEVLDGVLTDVAPVALDARFLGPHAADWLSTAVKASPTAPLALHLDPLSAFAQAGSSPGPIESHLIAAAGVAARLAPTHPRATLFLASGQLVHEAGGEPADELAFALAAALAYAKALVRAGVALEISFGAVVLGLAVDADPLISIAKLRAARMAWTRLAGACGVTRGATIEVRSSRRMLTRADAWTNLVRLTSAAFAGAVGGADAIVIGAFTDALGLPTAFARRMSRNLQLILMEEGHVGAVADPAAGAGALETLGADLARAAWAGFNAIEAAGGVVAALREGVIAQRVKAATADLAAGLADRSLRVVGVTDFRAGEAPAPTTALAEAVPVAAPDPRLPGPDSHCPALTPIRLEDLAPGGLA